MVTSKLSKVLCEGKHLYISWPFMYCIGFVPARCENGTEVCKLSQYFLVEMYSTQTMSSAIVPLLSALPPLLQCQRNFVFLMPKSEITKASG